MGLMAALLVLALAPPQGEPPDDARIRTLIDQLGADFLEERAPARRALEQAGKAAEVRLVASLTHPDFRVRRSCLELLTALKSSAALGRAVSLFSGDDDPSVREAAFHLFQALGKEAEEALIAALTHPNAEFRRGAAQSLAEFKSPACVGRVAELYDREAAGGAKDAAWKCLLAQGEAAEPFLLKYLADPDAAVRRGALAGLQGPPSDPAVAAVQRLFAQEGEETTLAKATEFLVRAGERGEPAFLTGLQNPRPGTRRQAILGLTAIKSGKALGPVAALFLAEAPPEVRGAAADYLKSRGLGAEDALLEGLASPEAPLRLISIQTLGEIESPKALEPVYRLFREETPPEVHRACFEFLKHLGLRAEEQLIGALADPDRAIRRQAVEALGDARSERAIPRLIEFMTELDPSMKEAAEAALASIGPKAIEEIGKAAQAGRLKKQVAEAIQASFVRGEVERLLETQLGGDGSTGFYEGQFKDLEAFGRDRAVPALIHMLMDPAYVFRGAHLRDKPRAFSATMVELAVTALGELGGDGVLEALKAFAQPEIQGRQSKRVHEETLVALHRLGEKKPLEEYLAATRASASSLLKAETVDLKNQGCDELLSLGVLLDRLKRYDEASRAYHEMIRAVDQYKLEDVRFSSLGTCYYNLACLSSKTGDRAKGVEWLGKAVRSGYTDREWMKKDKDLDGIRGEEGYKTLIADDALFEKKALAPAPADR